MMPYQPGAGMGQTAGVPDYLVQFMANVRAGILVPPTAYTGSMDMPPEIPGMPRMPGPPPGFMHGAPVGGLFQPLVPIHPFDPGNQVAQQSPAYGSMQEYPSPS